MQPHSVSAARAHQQAVFRDLSHIGFCKLAAAALTDEFIVMQSLKGCSLNNFLCEAFGKQRMENLAQSLTIGGNCVPR